MDVLTATLLLQVELVGAYKTLKGISPPAQFVLNPNGIIPASGIMPSKKAVRLPDVQYGNCKVSVETYLFLIVALKVSRPFSGAERPRSTAHWLHPHSKSS